MAANTENSDLPLGDGGGQSTPSKKSKPHEDPIARKLRLEKEARELQASLNDGVMSDVKTKVAWVLNMFPPTRNSDVSLTLKYWELFHSDLFNPTSMNPRTLFKMERETNIARMRAKIQNEYNLFPADEHVRRRRRELQEDVQEAVVEDKPGRNVVLVFADETGKNAEFVCVAAVWVLTGYTLFKLTQAIDLWQDTSPWAKKESHFTDLKNSQVIALGEYLRIVRKHREFLSFKVIGFERSTTKRKIDEIIMKLHEYMLIHGAKHEVDNNRIKLPHDIRLTVDAEQSLDTIACADMKSHIAAAYKTSYGDDLTIEDVSTISSHQSELVQLADVIAGAVNRRKNNKGERNHKDDMADMIITQLDIQLERDDVPGVDASTWLYL
jgi:hypothetical protein